MSWGDNYHSGPGYEGRCTECEGKTGTCYDELCEECEKSAPVQCPKCNEKVPPDFMTSHGICETCLEIKAEEFTTNFLNLTK